MLRALQTEIAALDAEISARAKRDDVAKRLMIVPRVAPFIATAANGLVLFLPAGRLLLR